MSQPAFQADAGDLANAGNATVYTGDPILTAEDTDGDGVVDRYGYDIADGVDPEPARWVGAQPEARDDKWVADAVADPTDAGRPVPAQDAAIPEYVPDPVYAPAVEASALDLPVTADPRYGSGADSDADGREADYEQETVNTFADTLQDTPSPERLDAMAAPDGYGSGADAEPTRGRWTTSRRRSTRSPTPCRTRPRPSGSTPWPTRARTRRRSARTTSTTPPRRRSSPRWPRRRRPTTPGPTSTTTTWAEP